MMEKPRAPLTAERLLAISQANIGRAADDPVFADVTDLLGDLLLHREQVAELTNQATVLYTALAAVAAAAEDNPDHRALVDGALRSVNILQEGESAFDPPAKPKPAPAPTKRTTAKKAPAKKAPAQRPPVKKAEAPSASKIVRDLADGDK